MFSDQKRGNMNFLSESLSVKRKIKEKEKESHKTRKQNHQLQGSSMNVSQGGITGFKLTNEKKKQNI